MVCDGHINAVIVDDSTCTIAVTLFIRHHHASKKEMKLGLSGSAITVQKSPDSRGCTVQMYNVEEETQKFVLKCLMYENI